MADWMDSLPWVNPMLLPSTFGEAADQARTDGRLVTALRRHTGRADRHSFRNARKEAAARRILEQLPTAGEVLHIVMDGAFDLAQLIPRILELAGEPATALDLMTLGFNDATIETLNRLTDAGQVQRLRLVCSHYFRSVDSELWSRAHAALTSRGHEAFIARNHAKLQLYSFTSGRRITLASSANLRSCKNLEFAILFGDDATFAFWSGIMDELIQEAKKCEAASRNPAAGSA